MVNKMYLNLPVKDLDRSKKFFTQLGFAFNPQFTDEKAACLVLGDHIYAMLLTESFFQTFTRKKISDAMHSTEMLAAIQVGSRQTVDDIAEKAIEAGGETFRDPDDHGWMYSRCFADPDGHQWEVMFMDESAIPEHDD